MHIIQPTIHHILYIESDSVQIARYGFLRGETKSIWVSLEDDEQRQELDVKLAELHQRGRIRFYVVSACSDDDGHYLEEIYKELDRLNSDIL